MPWMIDSISIGRSYAVLGAVHWRSPFLAGFATVWAGCAPALVARSLLIG